MNKTCRLGMIVLVLIISLFAQAEQTFQWSLALNDITQIPGGFPTFEATGFEKPLQTVRQLFYHHYLLFPGATYNDGYVVFSVIWPDTGDDPRYNRFREGIRKMLSERRMMSDGYVSTMQHIGLAHPEGWPFPFWIQSNGVGFHFSHNDEEIWRLCGVKNVENLDGWAVQGGSMKLDPQKGLLVEAQSNRLVLTSPAISVKGLVSPYVVLHWHLRGIQPDTVFYMEWATAEKDYQLSQRRYFSVPLQSAQMVQTAVPLYPLLALDDQLTGLRLVIENARGASVAIERLFTAVDTRHPCNNLVWLQGCTDYLNWTGELNFLRDQIQRWRLALRYVIDEFNVEKDKCIHIPWPNNDGRTGIGYDQNGQWYAKYGHGLGGGYFDLIPYGAKDGWNTIILYDVLLRMAELEQQIAAHPQWNIPAGPLRFEPAYLKKLADQVRKNFQKTFWNSKTGRFVMNVDRDGKMYDYGFLYYNLEAIYYGLASPRQARLIYDWIDGKRLVAGDTSKGKDIYYWRFAPRSTTKRNVDYYSYVWMPKMFEFGDQVQDGGAVLAWSYYDLMNRIRLNGPDDAWRRLEEIIRWFDEVQTEGGYRAYYAKPGRGLMQGGGQAGGLGLDAEFLESVMVPQVMLYGFMGAKPTLSYLAINPNLPSNWPDFTIRSIRWHGRLLDVTAAKDRLIVNVRQDRAEPAQFVSEKYSQIQINKEEK